MKILVHDYCGHPFQIQLSRWLAAKGHDVRHCYSPDIESPRGEFRNDVPRLAIEALGLGRPVPKYNLVRRVWHERRYAGLAAARVHAFRPDIVLSGNTPPAIQAALLRAAQSSGGAFVYWLQDIFSAVLERILPAKIPLFGSAIASQFRRYEFGVMARSDAVVVISEDFVHHCATWGVVEENILVQRNWAPLTEIVPMPRDNCWAEANGLNGKFVFLFSGTLGLKHNPALLSRLAESLLTRKEAVVAVVSQGIGRHWLEEEKKRKQLSNLKLFDFQPFAQLSDVFASADVLTAILEPFAGELSVPSKILSYLCAERPILAALPAQNLASRIVKDAGAGEVVSPADEDGFVRAAHSLMDHPQKRFAFAMAARAYAEQHFDIDVIGGRFLHLFNDIRLAR